MLLPQLVFAQERKVNPYSHVAVVTNTVNWPYDKQTMGNDSFKMGTVESGNEDSYLLTLIEKQKGF